MAADSCHGFSHPSHHLPFDSLLLHSRGSRSRSHSTLPLGSRLNTMKIVIQEGGRRSGTSGKENASWFVSREPDESATEMITSLVENEWIKDAIPFWIESEKISFGMKEKKRGRKVERFHERPLLYKRERFSSWAPVSFALRPRRSSFPSLPFFWFRLSTSYSRFTFNTIHLILQSQIFAKRLENLCDVWYSQE